jgi:murein endopeptidase
MTRVAVALAFALSACTHPGPARVPAPRPAPDRPAPAEPAPLLPAPPPAEAPSATAPEEQPPPPDDEAIDDEGEGDEGGPSETPLTGPARPHPLDGWSRARLERTLLRDPASLGSMSIGYTNAGALFNAVQMPNGDGWTLVDPDHAWGTQETVDDLTRAISAVRAMFPDTSPMHIGHISAKKGGPLSPHVSHQAGRDVDVSYYYASGAAWYRTATAKNLDRERTWTFIRALLIETDVELILIDRGVQRLLRDHAVLSGEDKAWVDGVFDGSATLRPIIRHAKGHATHIHVRFYNPVAQESGRRAYEPMVRHRLVTPPTAYTKYVAKKGDTLGSIARKFGSTAKAIQKKNGLKNNLIRAGAEYRIPRPGSVHPPTGPVFVPPRRLPPAEPSAAAQALRQEVSGRAGPL